MNTKPCKKCEETKPLSEYYTNRRMADGHLNTCKKCASILKKEHRKQNVEMIQARDRGRYDKHPEYREQRKIRSRNRTSDQNSLRGKRYRERYPERAKANHALNNAIRAGKIQRQPCEVCGTVAGVEGHHADYSKPLDVRWLCIQHHSMTRQKPRTEGIPV